MFVCLFVFCVIYINIYKKGGIKWRNKWGFFYMVYIEIYKKRNINRRSKCFLQFLHGLKVEGGYVINKDASEGRAINDRCVSS